MGWLWKTGGKGANGADGGLTVFPDLVEAVKQLPGAMKDANNGIQILAGTRPGTNAEGIMQICDGTTNFYKPVGRGCASFVSISNPAGWLYGSAPTETILFEVPMFVSNRGLNMLPGPQMPDTYITPWRDQVSSVVNDGLPGLGYTLITGKKPTDSEVFADIAKRTGMPADWKTVTFTIEQLNEKFTAYLKKHYNRPVTPDEYNTAIAGVMNDIRKEAGTDKVAIAMKGKIPGTEVEYHTLLEGGNKPIFETQVEDRNKAVIERFRIKKIYTNEELEKRFLENKPGLEGKARDEYLQAELEKFIKANPNVGIVDKQTGYLRYAPGLGQQVVYESLVKHMTAAPAPNLSNKSPFADEPDAPASSGAPASPDAPAAPAATAPQSAGGFNIKTIMMALGGITMVGGVATGGMLGVLGGAGMLLGSFLLGDEKKPDAPTRDTVSTNNTPADNNSPPADAPRREKDRGETEYTVGYLPSPLPGFAMQPAVAGAMR